MVSVIMLNVMVPFKMPSHQMTKHIIDTFNTICSCQTYSTQYTPPPYIGVRMDFFSFMPSLNAAVLRAITTPQLLRSFKWAQ
jgi:hypothetical protein